MRARSASGGAGEGRGGRVSESGSRASGRPPSPSSGGVVLPAAGRASSSDWLSGPRNLALAIGPRSCKLSRSAGRRGRRGGAPGFRPSPRPRAAESGPAPLRNVAGSARWGRGRAVGLSGGAGASTFPTGVVAPRGARRAGPPIAHSGEWGGGRSEGSAGLFWRQEALALPESL